MGWSPSTPCAAGRPLRGQRLLPVSSGCEGRGSRGQRDWPEPACRVTRVRPTLIMRAGPGERGRRVRVLPLIAGLRRTDLGIIRKLLAEVFIAPRCWPSASEPNILLLIVRILL